MSDQPNDFHPLQQEKHHRTAAQTAVLMMVLTLISKGIGFVRELTLAGYYGTSAVTDAYVMAQNIPSVLLGGILGSIGTAYTPLYSEQVETRGEDAGRRFTDQVLTLVFLVTLAALAAGILLSDQLVSLFTLNSGEVDTALTSHYLKTAFTYTFFTASISILDAYLHYNGRFLQPIIAGYFFNAGVILIIVISAHTSHYYLAWGATLGYFLQLVMILAGAKRSGYRYRPNLALSAPIRQIAGLAAFVFISASVSQINTFVDRMLASSLPRGSISSLNYGLLLTNLILSLTTSVITTIFYPKITQAVNRADWEYFNAIVQKTLSVVILILIPFSIGAVVFANPAVQVVYERGAFNDASTDLTADAFRFYSIGLTFMGINTLLHQIFISLRGVKTTVLCSVISICCNIVLNLLLIGPMQHRGLALATSAASFVSFLLLAKFLKGQHPEICAFPPRKKVLQTTLAAVLAVGTAILVYHLVQLVWMPRMIYLGLAVIAAAIVYLLFLKLFKIDEIGLLMDLVRR